MLILTCALLPPPGLAGALELQYAGTAGNSGSEGVELVKQGAGRQGGGVALDSAGRLWLGGGDRLIVVSAKGRQLWQTMLPQAGWMIGQPTFAVFALAFLYFFGGHFIPWNIPILCPGELYLVE